MRICTLGTKLQLVPKSSGNLQHRMGLQGMGTATSTTIQKGMLGLDMYDSANKRLVRRGTVSKTLEARAKPEKRQKNLDKAIAKLLKNYPPKKK